MNAYGVKARCLAAALMLGLATVVSVGLPSTVAHAEPASRQEVEFHTAGKGEYVLPPGARNVFVQVHGGDSARQRSPETDGEVAPYCENDLVRTSFGDGSSTPNGVWGGWNSDDWGDVSGVVSFTVGAGGTRASLTDAGGPGSSAVGEPSVVALDGVGSLVAPGGQDSGVCAQPSLVGAAGSVSISYELFSPVSLSPAVAVELVGRDATADDRFEFQVRPIGTRTQAAAAEGSVVLPGSSASAVGPFSEYLWAPVPFGALEFLRPGTYNFAVTQTNTGALQSGVSAVTHTATFAVTVTSDADGKLTATPSYGREGLRFTERYAEARARVDLTGAMVVKAADPRVPLPVQGGFSYGIEAVTAGAPLPPATTAVNDAAGQVTFGAVEFGPADLAGASEIGNGLVAKTFVYRVTQSGEVAEVTNDTSSTREFGVRVVRDTGTGTLTASTSAAPLFAFANSYTPAAAGFTLPRVSLRIAGFPSTSGRTARVELSADDPATSAAVARGEVTGSSQMASVSAGSVAAALDFGDIAFSRPGSYSFRLAEEPPPDVVASDGTCVFTVEVADDGSGQFAATLGSTSPSADCFALENTYAPRAAQLALRGIVSVDIDPAGAGLMLGVGDIAPGYSYTVTSVGGAPLPSACGSPCTVAMDAAGNVDLGMVEFGRDLLVGATSADFTYRVTQAGSHRGVTNDPTATRQFTVRVTEDPEGRLAATLQPSADGVAFAFTNSYSVQPATTAAIDASLQVNGADATGKLFDFEIVARGADTEAAVSAGDVTLPAREEVTGGTDGTVVPFAFNGITFTRPGTFFFTARQLTASLPADFGPQVDVVDFSVTATDKLDGTLRTVLDVPAGGLAFVDVSPAGTPPTVTPAPPPTRPTPAPAHVTVPATMTLVGRDALAGEQATLTIRAVNGAATAGVDAGSIQLPSAATVALGANGEAVPVTLGDIEFTQPGRYQFTVSRMGGSATGVSGLVAAVAFTIDVTDNADGTMTVTLLAPPDGPALIDSYATTAHRFRFAGLKSVAHDPEDGSLDMTATDLAGRYTFTLAAPAGAPLPDGCSTVCEAVGDSNGVVDFGSVGYTVADLAGSASTSFTYTVSESGSAPGVVDDPASVKTVVVTLTDNEDGTLTIDADDGSPVFSFTNTYTPQPVSVPLKASWTIHGRDMAPGETAAFQVISADPSDTGITLPAMSTVGRGVDGQPSPLSLGTAIISKPGLYELVARVVNDDPTWDVTAVASEFAFTVAVTDTGDGTLQAATRLPDGGLAFTGESAETATTQLEVTGLAVLDLASATLAPSFEGIAGQFQFTLTATEPTAPLPLSAKTTRNATGGGRASLDAAVPMPPSVTATNDATGAVRFGPVTFTSADLGGATSRTFGYRVTQAGWTAGVDNDADEVTGVAFTITVTIDSDGRLSHTTSPAGDLFEFTNTYGVEPVSAVIQAEKTLNGRLLQADEFEFALTGGDGSRQGVRHDAQGVANFAPIVLTVPGKYSYLIEEVPGDDADIVYDRQATLVMLTATDDGAGGLDVSADPSSIVAFVNHCVDMDGAPYTCDPSDGSLAFTGAAVTGLVVVAGLLICSGVWLTRRRTATANGSTAAGSRDDKT